MASTTTTTDAPRTFFRLSLLVALALVAGSAWAEESAPPQRQGPPDLDEVMGHLTSELDLSEEQATEVRTILEEQRQAMEELREIYGRPEDPEDRDRMREQVGEILRQSDQRLSQSLDPEQMERYRKMRRGRRHQRPDGNGRPPKGPETR